MLFGRVFGQLFLMAMAVSMASFADAAAPGQRTVIDLVDKWRYHAGETPEAAASEFDDSDWRAVDLPHDGAFEAGVSSDGAQGASGGYYPGGISWYRKTFTKPTLSARQTLTVEFDGVYRNSEVWVNGFRLGRFPYGYLSFQYELTPHLVEGDNTLVVRCDNSKEPSARWYHPAGIYAPVRLVAKSVTHIENVYVTTPDVDVDSAEVRVETEWVGPQGMTIVHEIQQPDGVVVARSTGSSLRISNPRLWSVESPSLYALVTTLSQNGRVVDRLSTRFGIRSIRWETDTGFWLNEKNVKLLGVCEHWEGGPVGGAWSRELMRWKLETLRAMGCNSIRTAHNPCPPFFYDLCDEMGFLVMDEIFDGWKRKARHDYGEEAFAERWKIDLRTWLKRDRNHPSIVIWSVGNETRGPVAKELVEECHRLDPTRPVTSGHSGSEHMDVYGINGGSESKSYFTQDRRPKSKPFIATEAPHTWQVRGYYRSKTWWRDGPKSADAVFPLKDLTEEEVFTYDWTDPAKKANPVKQIFNSSYDNATVRISARQNWELMRDLPWYAGHFRWTGFDYPGEAGYVHGGFPFRAFMGGSHDLAGFPKDLAFFYQSQWTREPMVHVLPHWTHPKTELGTLIPVWAYSNAEQVELFLNGESLGVQRPGRLAEKMQCEWLVPWQPGKLTAIARNAGAEVARAEHSTAGPPTQLGLEVDARDEGVTILTTTLRDADGTPTPYADNRVYFDLPDGFRLLSHENGNPVDTENGVTSSSRRAFMGLTRSFTQAKSASNDGIATVGAILGARNGVTDLSETPLVTLEVLTVPLEGEIAPRRADAVSVYYTTEGALPTENSPVYNGPFAVTLPTTVRALVVRDDEVLFTMEERFDQQAGLYWSQPGDAAVLVGLGGAQAEEAELLGHASVATGGAGFRGTGYVDLSHAGDGITWYQENDGVAKQVNLRFRYAQQDAQGNRTADIFVNGTKIKRLVFSNTGSWDQHWKEIELPATIGAGANEILIRTTERGGPRIDELLVE